MKRKTDRVSIDLIDLRSRIEVFRSDPAWKNLSLGGKIRALMEITLNGGDPPVHIDKEGDDRAKNFIRDLALGRPQNILDVQRLADELGVPSQRLAEIIVKQNGDKKDVPR